MDAPHLYSRQTDLEALTKSENWRQDSADEVSEAGQVVTSGERNTSH